MDCVALLCSNVFSKISRYICTDFVYVSYLMFVGLLSYQLIVYAIMIGGPSRGWDQVLSSCVSIQ